jgi:signal transduction histidine kinase/ligand-binding sensor domain-containing protein/AraC-like DNA-binding protein/AmiR/NasT family two-component response regulator
MLIPLMLIFLSIQPYSDIEKVLPENHVFEHLTTMNGLSSNSIKSIHQDKSGLIWIGTFDGLNRYDGVYFKLFKNMPNRFSQIVHNLSSDSLGNIWYASDLLIKNVSGNFQKFYLHIDNKLKLAQGVEDFIFGNDEKVYVAIKNKIYSTGIYTNDSVLYEVSYENYRPDFERINCLRFDQYNQLWIGTDAGFFVLNLHDDNLTFFEPIEYPDSKYIRDFIFDYQGNLWVAFYNKLSQYNFKNKTTIAYPLPGVENPVITSIYISQNRNLWVGTLEQGLFYLNYSSKKIHCLIDQTSISKVCEDRSNRLWIGTENKGIFIYDSLRNYFKQLPIEINQKQILSFHADRVINEDDKGLWIGSRSFGLLYFDLKTLKTQIIDPHNNQINTLFKDEQNRIWYDHIHYLVCYDPENKTIKRIKHPVPHQYPVLNYGNNLSNMLVFNNQFILSSDYGLVYTFDPAKEKFNLILDNSGHEIRSMLVKDSKLLICIYRLGIIVLDESLNPVDTLYHVDTKNGLINHSIMAIHNDKYDSLWVGGYGGLSKYNPLSHQFETVLSFNDAANFVTSILEDETGDLWIGSSKGIYRYHRIEQRFTLFDSNHGMPTGRFFSSSATQTPDGKMYFGGNNGIIYFNPIQIKLNESSPSVVFTDFIIYKSVSDNHQDYLYSINHIDHLHGIIRLNYRQNSFTIRFAALNYTSPLYNQYKFKMKGLDDEWHFSGNQSHATFTNLSGGKYIFSVKGSNNDGIWNDDPQELVIVIGHPPWKSPFAYILYVVLLTSALSAIYYHNLRKIRLQHQLTFKEKEAETLRQIDNAKTRFFTNISHEFRTPLTLILDPANRLLNEKDIDPSHKKLLKLILNNAGRLLFLITQILDLAKIKSGKLSLKVEKTDIVKFLNPILHSFSSKAEASNLTYKILIPSNELFIWIDREKIEKTVINLLSNAFKFCPKGTITVEVKEENDQISIKIRDTGIGIARDQIENIFAEYYQAENHLVQSTAGTGIGLALVKEYIDMHHANLKVESEEFSGTTFTIHLRKGKSHFQPFEIIPETIICPGNNIPGNFHLNKGNNSIKPDAFQKKPVVLLIEDNVEMKNYIKDALDEKYLLFLADNGLEGFEIILNQHPEVVISDVMMPVMDGFAFCKKAKEDERTSHIPIILLTARNEHEDKIKGLCLGADDYIKKPFKLDELVLRINYHLEISKKIKDKFLRDFKFKTEDEFSKLLKDEFLQKVLNLMEKHFQDDQFGVEKLSELMGMGRKHIYRKIKALTNQNPNELIRNFRLRKAAVLLSESRANVSQVCFEVGFNNLSYFSRCFYEFYGKHPSEWRAK